jgi:hypothetical protein
VHGDVVLAQVDAVGVYGGGDVGAVVDDEDGAGGFRGGSKRARDVVDLAWSGVLLSKL